MIVFDDEYNGKPFFEVGFLDFCKIVCREDKKKFNISDKKLFEHIVKKRYSKDYVVSFDGIVYTP